MSEQIKDLEYYRKNCEENYITTPISVLRYITELENHIAKLNKHNVSNQREQLIAFFDYLNKQDNITNMYTDKYMYIDKYLESN